MNEYNKQSQSPTTHHAIRARVRRRRLLLLGVVSALAAGRLADDLDPVAVRIQRKGDVLHAAVRQPLLEPVAGVLEAAAGGLDAVDADADVAEAAVGLGVAAVDLVVRVVLGPVVVRQLDHALAVEDAAARGQCAGAVVRQEVQVELVVGERQLLH